MQTTLFTKIGDKLYYTEWTKKPILEFINDWIIESNKGLIGVKKCG